MTPLPLPLQAIADLQWATQQLEALERELRIGKFQPRSGAAALLCGAPAAAKRAAKKENAQPEKPAKAAKPRAAPKQSAASSLLELPLGLSALACVLHARVR